MTIVLVYSGVRGLSPAPFAGIAWRESTLGTFGFTQTWMILLILGQFPERIARGCFFT